jgi:DNA (cytosine-5)-methyltransferase 1
MGRPIAIDLFCGCGGLTLGLKSAGFRVVGAVDNDPLSVETYKLNHPRVKVWETDIRKLKVSAVKKKLNLWKGELDLLAGCPPCQGFSTVRTLNGGRRIEDERNDLIYEFLRFVEGLRPKTVMMENVPGLAVDKRMEALMEQLTELGYSGEFRILDAADYGVPQRRRRVIVLAGRFGPVDFASPEGTRLTVRNAIGNLPAAGMSSDSLHDMPEKRAPRVVEFIGRIPKDGGSRLQLGEDAQLSCHKKCNGFKDIYGRMAWDQPAPTITSGCVNPSKGRFLHPEEDRSITLREAALLQGFPVDYRISLRRGKFPAAALIGNALPPAFVAAQADAVSEYLANRSRRNTGSS